MVIYAVLASLVLALHALFIMWVIFGAFLTRHSHLLRNLHITSILWGVLIEIVSWPCPLTLAENWLESRAGSTAYHTGFLLHYLDKFVYPDVPPELLTVAAVLVCLANLAVYGIRYAARRKRTHEKPGVSRHPRK
jgi:hypothetical protein